MKSPFWGNVHVGWYLLYNALGHAQAIMQNMIFDSVFEVDSVLEKKSDFLIVADSILNKRI